MQEWRGKAQVNNLLVFSVMYHFVIISVCILVQTLIFISKEDTGVIGEKNISHRNAIKILRPFCENIFLNIFWWPCRYLRTKLDREEFN